MWFEKYNIMNEAGEGGSDGGGGADAGNADSGADAAAVAAAVGGQSAEGGADGSQAPAWAYAEGIDGEGDAPEWFKVDKYKSVSEQAKAYTELESKFGSFTGAPEEYAIQLSEQLTEQGIEIAADDPIMEEAFKFAKESNMSQDGFDQMVNLYAMTRVAEGQAFEDSKAEQIQSLGANAQQRLSNLDAWAKANMSSDMQEGFQDLATTSEGVKALEHLIAKTRGAPISPDAVSNAGGATHEEVQSMLFEKDEHGNRRIQTDPEFKARYQKMRDQVWGGEEHRVIVGG